MDLKLVLICIISFSISFSSSQVLQFGVCPEIDTVMYFDIEKFVGKWYEIERFPTWYEQYGDCAYKTIQLCGKTQIQVEHGFVKNEIMYVLHVNSSYAPAADAVFAFNQSNIDPIAMPLSVIATDYNNYAVVYGCKSDNLMGIKYLSAWILSRESSMEPEIYEKAREILTSIPHANAAYLEPVYQDEEKCSFQWTAHIQAEELDDLGRKL